jgi:hypothetical protein
VRVRRIILSPVACMAPPHFSTLSYKWKDFRKTIIAVKTCVFIFYKFIWNFSHCKKESVRYYHKHFFMQKYPLCFSDFNKTLTFSTDFRSILKYQISWKSVRWEPSCSMRTYRQTDRRTEMTKLIVALRKYAKTPKNWCHAPGAIWPSIHVWATQTPCSLPPAQTTVNM